MMRRTLKEIAVMAGGTLSENAPGELAVAGVSKDTRTIEQGCLYVPIIGASFDGHDFVGDALERGAAAALWQSDRPNPPEDAPLIFVDDSLKALQQLALAYRRQLPVRIVGVTGSNGKTTTKDLTAAVLSASFEIHKTAGNYNNHIGLPLTLLQLSEQTEIAVLEMGMSGRGEIELLSQLAEPEIVVITNIGEAHMLQLGSRKEIARAKTEILAGLLPNGVLVYNGDEPLIEEVLPELAEPGRMRTDMYSKIKFGTGVGNDLYPEQVTMDAGGSHFRVHGDATEYYVPLLGVHNVVNAMAAIAVGRHFGMSGAAIAQGLKQTVLTGMRIEVSRTAAGLTLLNDAYNASPTSMRAAISLLHELTGYSRKFAVLGDMLELGVGEAEYHREVGKMLDPGQVAEVYFYGPLSTHTAEGAREHFPADRVHHFEHKEALAEQLGRTAAPDDVILVKGSRGMRMEEVIVFLKHLGG